MTRKKVLSQKLINGTFTAKELGEAIQLDLAYIETDHQGNTVIELTGNLDRIFAKTNADKFGLTVKECEEALATGRFYYENGHYHLKPHQ